MLHLELFYWWPQRDSPEFAPRLFRVVWGAA